MKRDRGMSARDPLGTALMYVAMLVWLSVSVGPWWLGVALFCAAWAINAVELKWWNGA